MSSLKRFNVEENYKETGVHPMNRQSINAYYEATLLLQLRGSINILENQCDLERFQASRVRFQLLIACKI